MTVRTLTRIIRGLPASDGAGVKLTRSLGARPDDRVDPFLMLDEIGSDDAADYIAGFPAHPHRGFETFTYLVEGHMLHEDHLGNRGDLKSGGVQWMTAGRGIIHSEMPQQAEGRLHGFQLWVNLPAAEKMKPAGYRDVEHDEIPVIALAGGGCARIIAGTVTAGGETVAGPVQGLTTELVFADVELPAGAVFETPLPVGHSAFVYPFAGEIAVGEDRLPHGNAGMLGDGDNVRVSAGSTGSRFLLLAGRPIGEPIAQYGPFVMNTREELEQAMRDYRDGTLTA